MTQVENSYAERLQQIRDIVNNAKKSGKFGDKSKFTCKYAKMLRMLLTKYKAYYRFGSCDRECTQELIDCTAWLINSYTGSSQNCRIAEKICRSVVKNNQYWIEKKNQKHISITFKQLREISRQIKWRKQSLERIEASGEDVA